MHINITGNPKVFESERCATENYQHYFIIIILQKSFFCNKFAVEKMKYMTILNRITYFMNKSRNASKVLRRR